MDGEKTCTKCGVSKPPSEYHKEKRTRDGLRSACKECHCAASRAWAAANRERVRENNRAWHAANRERHLESNRAWKEANRERARENSRAWNRANRERTRETGRAWYEANRERTRETVRAWRAANPDKKRKMDHRRRARKGCGVPQRWRVHEIIPFACYWCGANLRAYGAETHVDHVLPIALGGPADQTNEVSACSDCNIRKGARHPLVWIAELVAR